MKLKAEQKFDEALIELNQLLDQDPKNRPALEQKALMLGWTQRFQESIEIWRELTILEPNNLKFKVGMARVTYWNEDYRTANYYLAEVLTIDPTNKEAADLAITVGRARQRIQTTYRLDMGQTIDTFSAVRDQESSSFLQAGMKANSEIDIFLRYENQYQFKSTDQAVGLGAYYKIHPDWLLSADLTQAVYDPSFRAKTITNFAIENSSFKPITFSTSYGSSIYQQGPVSTFQLGAALNIDLFTIDYKYGISKTIDSSTTTSSQVKLSYHLTDSVIINIAYAAGEEALPPLAKAKVVYLPIDLQLEFDVHNSVRLDYVQEDRANAYKHQSMGLSYAYKF